MAGDGAMMVKSLPPFRANLRTGLTYFAFCVGHIWAAFSIFVLVGVAHSATYDWPMAIENGWTDEIASDIALIFAVAAHAALVIWLLYKGWHAWRREELTLRKAAWPLVTFGIFGMLAAALATYIVYSDWQHRRHAGTGTLSYKCVEFDRNGFEIAGQMTLTHQRSKMAYNGFTQLAGGWMINIDGGATVKGEPVEIHTGSIGGSYGLKWTSNGEAKVAALSFTDMITEYGSENIGVDIGPAANVPVDWYSAEGRRLRDEWIERRFECFADQGSWRPD